MYSRSIKVSTNCAVTNKAWSLKFGNLIEPRDLDGVVRQQHIYGHNCKHQENKTCILLV